MDIDIDCGALFDLDFIDINGDGKIDILVTNHENEPSKSAVFGYEIPSDYKSGHFMRHTLASGFVTRKQPVSDNASPGNAFPFFPKTDHKPTDKPHIAVSGDGAESFFLVTPDSADPNNWGYSITEVLNEKHTIGTVTGADVDGDGYTELFVAVYETGKIHVFTYKN